MCDKELLLGYLYDELAPSDRQAFDRHLASCAECREEVDGLGGTRTHLMSWAPPEPDLGFQIVRSAKPAARDVPPARWWRASPAWGLAAAAMLTLAVSAAIANVEVRAGSDGIVVRTGWNRRATGAPGQTPAAQSAASASELQKVEARLKELESQLAARQTAAAPVVASAVVGRMSDADVVRLVRQLVSDSEQRQQVVLARQILQVNRDTETARRADIDRLLVAYRQLQGTNFETSQRTKALEDHVLRVGLQR
jgi:anti-sigma factor RsiW